MYDAGARFRQVDLLALSQVCRCILNQVIISITVNTHYNRGFQLARCGLAADKKTEPQLVTVISRLGGRWPEIGIMYFTTFYMLAITPEGHRHK